MRLIVAGIGLDVGKTVVSAILTNQFKGNYWKPIQCGIDSDSATVHSLTSAYCFPNAYQFSHPLSPHHAARLENQTIERDQLHPPESDKPLIIECCGGALVPYTSEMLQIDAIKQWGCPCLIVSKHYLGSINHTLLTLSALKAQKIPLLGLVFNGDPYPDGEAVILKQSSLPMIGRLSPEPEISRDTIKKYEGKWKI